VGYLALNVVFSGRGTLACAFLVPSFRRSDIQADSTNVNLAYMRVLYLVAVCGLRALRRSPISTTPAPAHLLSLSFSLIERSSTSKISTALEPIKGFGPRAP